MSRLQKRPLYLPIKPSALATEEHARARIAAHNHTTVPVASWPDVLARTTQLYELATKRQGTEVG